MAPKIEKTRRSNISMLFRSMEVKYQKIQLKELKFCFQRKVEKLLGLFKALEVFDSL